jgi:hypothetical protein
MSEGSPIERLRSAGLHDAPLDLLGIDEGVALREIGPFLAWVELPRGARTRESVDFYPAPPLQRIGLLRWKAFDKVVDIGYRYAVEAPGPEVVARLCGGST